MTLLIRILAILPALMFLGIWLQWLFMPAEAAGSLGMPLLGVPEASTQIGDLGAFFLVAGGMAAFAQLPGKAHCFYAPAGLLLAAAGMRTAAWLTGHAEFATQHVISEIVIAAVWLAAARRLGALH
ncbi:MAG: hypothetical protein AAEJ53_10400 [Myxococcota bacterium]